jgi:hypothetical protein
MELLSLDIRLFAVALIYALIFELDISSLTFYVLLLQQKLLLFKESHKKI